MQDRYDMEPTVHFHYEPVASETEEVILKE